MKLHCKKIVTALLAMLMLTTVSCGAASTTTFSDVPEDFWGYETIMDMTRSGLFKGTTDPVNGVGTFSPNRAMTRAEFITVSLRAIYPKEANATGNTDGKWWNGYYNLALEKGIVSDTELNSGDLDQPMSREEMAMVMVRCVEQNGENLSHRVSSDRIPDYAAIGDYYKEYVLDCFSYGLLCGVDDKGTFAPQRSLTRAQAATVLCRLLDKDMRVDINGTKEDSDFTDVSNLPWENGGKKPEQYTWAEFEALTPAHQMAFQNSFSSPEKFDQWMQKAQAGGYPWEDGGKKPEQYTWKEYQALTPAQQIAFQNSFSSSKKFNEWMEKALAAETDNPWENGGKKPEQYTWAEFEALTADQQIAFQNSFSSFKKFEEWMNQAQAGENPWENGGKKPEQYTWAEFEALTADQQIAFQNSFSSFKEFEEWMNQAQAGKNPWENGGKKPEQYTWADFMALTPAQQIAFQSSFTQSNGFEKWLTANEP